MIKHRETRIEHLVDAMAGWPGYWRVALLFLGVGALFVALGFGIVAQLSTPVLDAEPGTVVRFSGRAGSRHIGGGALILLVRTNDGRIRELSPSGADVHHCRVGSPIRLLRRGSRFLIHPDGCPPPS